MFRPNSQTIFRATLYGGASVLLMVNLFFLLRAAFLDSFIPIVPVVAGVFTAAGLLFIVYAEHASRQADKAEHRRISRVAHQLEAPLVALESDVASLLKQSDSLPPSARLKLKHMATKNNILLTNVRDVFLMLRAHESLIAQEKRVYNLCAVVQEVIDRQQPFAKARNVEITHRLHCQNAPVRIDRRLMIIALTHLLENAMHYTLTPGLANVVVIRGKKRARVIIQDRGIGLRKKDRAVVFLPFARGVNAEKYDPDGIGVGITLSRLIIREFGGDLVYSARGPKIGSQFEIALPLAKV